MKTLTFAWMITPLTMALVACGSQVADLSPDGLGTPVKVEPLPPSGPIYGGGPSDHSKRYFMEWVYPSLLPTCGQCHTEGQPDGLAFLASSAEDAYKLIRDYKGGALIAVPEKNLLLAKQKHEGPELTEEQRGIILEWLAKEYPGRSPVPLPPTVYEALADFGTCVYTDEFAPQAGQIYLTPTDGACTCETCHGVAEADLNGAKFVLDPDVNATAAAARQYPGVLRFVAPKLHTTGAFDRLVPSHRIAQKGQEPTPQSGGLPNENCSCQIALGLKVNGAINMNDPTYCHPHYVLPEPIEASLDAWVSNTINRSKSQVCEPETP
jgi:hypothetical protein